MSIDKLATDEQECLVMFNRAVEYNDSVAWQFLHQRFRGMMRHWLQQYLVNNGRYWIESYENCIDLAFERVWFAASYKQRIHFESLAAALQYLRVSLISVALDMIRGQKRKEVLSMQQLDLEETLAQESREEAVELWQEIKRVLPDEREQRAAYLLFCCNLKPRQIVQFYPDEFHEVQELYRISRKVFERFRNNAETLRWRLQG